MKMRLVASAVSIFLCVIFSLPSRSSGQQMQAGAKKAERYRLVDLGTLGGPNSYLPAFYIFNTLTPQALSADGTFAGWADTSETDPLAPNNCFLDCSVDLAIKWKNGVTTPLSTLPGPPGLSAAATWISNNGLISGFAENGEIDPILGFPEVHGVLWRNGGIVDLKTLEGGYESLATAVNSGGEVVGFSSNSTSDPLNPNPNSPCRTTSMQCLGTQTRAFLWQNGELKDLDTLGGTDAQAFYINEQGQIVGQSYTADSAPAPPLGCWLDVPLASHSFLWENGKMTDLLTLGGSCTEAYAINDRGEVVGQSNRAGDLESHPFIWGSGTMKDLHTLGGTYGFASWLNNSGEVVGSASVHDMQDLVAFYWKDGEIRNLGTANGDTCSVADAINSEGQIVGGSGLSLALSFPACNDPVEHAVLWQGGQLVDLNAFVPPTSDLTLTEAVFINDRGEIAGFATLPNSNIHAFLLIPCGPTDGESCLDASADASAVAARHNTPASEFPAMSVGLRNLLGGGMLGRHHNRLTPEFRNSSAALLSAPNNLISSTLNTYQIQINWQQASGQNQTGFNIYRCRGCASPRTEGTKIVSVGANVFGYTNGSTTSPLTETTAYTYQVTVFRGSSESGPSNGSSATTKTEPAPTNLTSFAFARGFDQIVSLDWTNNAADDDSYFLESCSGSTCTNFSVVAQLPANTTSDRQYFQFSQDKTFRYRVRTHSPGGFSAYSNVRNQLLP